MIVKRKLFSFLDEDGNQGYYLYNESTGEEKLFSVVEEEREFARGIGPAVNAATKMAQAPGFGIANKAANRNMMKSLARNTGQTFKSGSEAVSVGRDIASKGGKGTGVMRSINRRDSRLHNIGGYTGDHAALDRFNELGFGLLKK